MITSPINGAATTQPAPAPAATIAKDPLASKDTFLKLLVAQIRNQDPLSPADGTQFVAQLAQFSGLEQTIDMRQNIEAIRKLLEAQSATPPASASATNS